MNVDLIIKQFSINVLIYLIAFKILNIKEVNYRQIINSILGSLLTTIIYILLKKYVDTVFLLAISFMIQSIFLSIMIRENLSIIIINLLSNAIAYAIYTIATIVELVPKIIFKIKISSIDLTLITIISIILFGIFLRIKRFKNGFKFLQSKEKQEYINSMIISICSTTLLGYCLFGDYDGNLMMNLIVVFVILTIIMFIMIQKTLILYYKQKLLEKTMADYEEEIKQKDEIIKELSEEKFKISKVNHEFYNRQKSLEKAVKDFINNTSTEMGNELTIINKINNLSKEYSNKMEKIKQVEKLPLTDVEEIDEMFKYMQSECIKNNIDFRLKIEGNII